MVKDLLTQAYGAMRHNRRRTALTMLGMAWGIATVVLLLAYGAGFGRAIETIFANWGTRIIGVFPGRTSQQAGGQKAGTKIRFTFDDIDRIVNAAPLVHRITPMVEKQSNVQQDVRTYTLPINGVYPTMFKIQALNLGEGRLLNEDDEMSRARVAVIGSEAKIKLFSGQYALGQFIRIDGISFQVVGVLSPHMQEGDDSVNKLIYIPFTTMSDLKDTHYLDGIWLDYEGNEFELVEHQVRGVLAQQYNFKPDDKRAVFVFNMMKQLKQFQIITTGLQVLLAFIGTLTLGIGGVGLMNIMLVSVTQRTREIGVEKALGGRRRDILFQFLAEALAITFAGGIAGIAMAYAISHRRGPPHLLQRGRQECRSRRYPAHHRSHDRLDRHHHSDVGGPGQRNAARHQSLAPRSHRSAAVRVGRKQTAASRMSLPRPLAQVDCGE